MQPDAAAQRLHPVPEPDKAGAAAEVRAAAPVIADAHMQHAVADGHLDFGDAGAGVLGGVGERLGDRIVGGDLGRLGQPPRRAHIEADRDGAAAGQRP